MNIELSNELLTIREGFLRNGVAFWPALLSAEQAADLRLQTVVLEERRSTTDGVTAIQPHLVAMEAQRTYYLNDLQVGQSPAPQALARLVQPVVEPYLSHAPQPAANSFVRHVGPDRKQAYLPFHQDESILNRRMVNVWIALDRAGEEAPGLEFVVGVSTLLPTAPDPDGVKRPWDPIARDSLPGTEANRLRPIFKPGDAVIFAGTTPHRTYGTDNMTASRRSIELRLV